MPPSNTANETEFYNQTNEEQQMNETILANLPKEERWKDELDMYQYQGFWYNYCFLGGIMSTQENFKAKTGDIFLCSYPKTGMTWLKALSFSIVTRKIFKNLFADSPLLTNLPHECVPFLEINLAAKGFVRDKKFPLFATHLPYTSLPKSMLQLESSSESGSVGCKIVYLYRDPKDTFVCLWHFLIKFVGNINVNERKQGLCFETEFDRFCNGKSLNGPFWDHVLGFWNASLENPDRVLFLKFEDLKNEKNDVGLCCIRRLAGFLNQPFSEEEEIEGVPDKIMELCSFENLSNLEVNKTGNYCPQPGVWIQNSAFFRKGVVGDWKNYLTEEMADRIDAITQQKFCNSGFQF